MHARVLICLLGLGAVSAAIATASDALALLSELPSCPMNCLVESAPAGPCDLLDIGCQCKSDRVTRSAANCLMAKCPLNESIALAKVQASVCDLPHDSKNGIIWGISIATGATTFIMATLRVASRYISRNKLWYDDGCQVLGAVVMIPLLAIALLVGSYGMGKHVYDIDWSRSYIALWQYYYLAEVIYHVHSTLIKLSMLFFYLRIFPNKGTKRAVYLTIAFLVVSQLAVTLLTAFQCQPVRAAFDLNIKNRKCLNLPRIAYSGSAFNITAEIIIFVIPIPIVRSLHMDISKKIGLFILFSMGLIVIAMACVRMPTLQSLNDYRDLSYTFAPSFIWSCAEILVSNVVVAVPVVNLLFQIAAKRFKTSTSKLSDSVSQYVMAPMKRKLNKSTKRHSSHASLRSTDSRSRPPSMLGKPSAAYMGYLTDKTAVSALPSITASMLTTEEMSTREASRERFV